MHDLVIRGGLVASAAGAGEADLGITGGQVAQLGGAMRGRTELEAAGALVLPGAVDMHVHLSANGRPPQGPPAFVDTFDSGTRAAAAGGVTTVGVMTFPAEHEGLASAVTRHRGGLQQKALVDWLLHPGVVRVPEGLRVDLAQLARAGHRSFKVFLAALDAGDGELVSAVAAAGGHGMLTMVHCEDQALLRFSAQRLLAEGHGGLAGYAASRPTVAEVAAVQRAIAICELTGAPIYLVHVSSRRALAAARDARAAGLPVFVETRPMYLHFTQEVYLEPDGGKYIGQPPLRWADDVKALWEGIAGGAVDTLGSDHAPWLWADKLDPQLDVTTARPGVAELETMLPALYSYGVAAGRITLERLVALTATNPARLFGLYPRKGTIAVGGDADLVVLDPKQRRRVDGARGQSLADYSIYDGQELLGWPRFTISRGTVVCRDGEITAAPGRGREVQAGPLQHP